jgi:hypothetical protein
MVMPHDHTYATGGPLDIRIASHSYPPMIETWPLKKPIRVHLEQPVPEESNFTLLSFAFGPGGAGKWYNVHGWRRKGNTITLYLKARITRSVPHPIPLGPWQGASIYSPKQARILFQRQTLVVKPPEPEPSRIILPDDGRSKRESQSRIVLP